MDIIAAAPTRFELAAITPLLERYRCPGLVSGVGPAMTAHMLTRYFEASMPQVLLLCGLGGLYSSGSIFEPEVFLAETEFMADLGRCSGQSIQPLEIEEEEIRTCFHPSHRWEAAISPERIASEGFITARMATVSCTSADRRRARLISDLFEVQVENMEGAAAALVCMHYDVCLYEFRAVSNIAGETDRSAWRIPEALESLFAEVDRFLGLLYR